MAAHKGNLYAIGNTGGRPPKFETWQDLHSRCAMYFNNCHQHDQHYTVSGLVLFLGFSSKQMLDYQKKRSPEFEYVVCRAFLAITASYESMLHTKQWKAAIWALKNMGWGNMSNEEIKHLTKPNLSEQEKQQLVVGLYGNKTQEQTTVLKVA